MNDTLKTQTIERDGLQFKVDFLLDESPDTSGIGEYSSDWEPGAIDRATSHPMTDYHCPHTAWDRRQYRYFIPACNPAEMESERVAFTQLGYSKHDAWLRACAIPRWQYRAMEALNNGAWSFIGITVTASVAGVEVAHDALWGIEYGTLPDVDPTLQESYHAEIIEDCISECIAQLPTTADTLKEVITVLQPHH